MKKMFLDVPEKDLPISWHKWHKKKRPKDLPKKRYISAMNDYKDFPLKFYKRIV